MSIYDEDIFNLMLKHKDILLSAESKLKEEENNNNRKIDDIDEIVFSTLAEGFKQGLFKKDCTINITVKNNNE